METSDAKVIDCISGRSVPVNVDEMQKKLSQKATKEPEHHFENLYGLLCHEVWLRPEDADRLENLQVLCTEHHRAKTKTDLKVLSRVR